MGNNLQLILRFGQKIIPHSIYKWGQPIYHYTLSLAGAVIYRFPARHIKVIAITGTKGKSSTTEITNAILEAAGYKTALSNTIRYKVGVLSRPNLFKMSMPGRFFLQKLLREAVKDECDYFILETTSQGALNYRHKFLHMDVFAFTNISPEHIDAHGSFLNYLDAKLRIARELKHSSKPVRTIVVNGDDPASAQFLACQADHKVSFGIKDAEPYSILPEGIDFTLTTKGEKNSDEKNPELSKKIPAHSPLSGLFNLYNIMTAVTIARTQNVPDEIIIKALADFSDIKGRVQYIPMPAHVAATEAGFSVVVDYAHTPDSLSKLYAVFANKKIIAVLGGTGGGRDNWKRKEMGYIADTTCYDIILTDEDPYDEDPQQIVADVATGISIHTPTIIMDRRAAIREALERARTLAASEKVKNSTATTATPSSVSPVVVLITGKGTDPYIMGPNGTKTPWSDANVAHEELHKMFS